MGSVRIAAADATAGEGDAVVVGLLEAPEAPSTPIPVADAAVTAAPVRGRARAPGRVRAAPIPVSYAGGSPITAHTDPGFATTAAELEREVANRPDAIASAAAESNDSPGAVSPARSYVSPGVARSLRVYDEFPSLPESERRPGFAQAVDVEVCVSDRGGVSHVTMDHRAAPALERVLRNAIRTWRYRPLVVRGAAQPFCHGMQIRYLTN